MLDWRSMGDDHQGPGGLRAGALAAGVGVLGLLAGPRGAFDPVGFLAWLALIGLPAGILVGRSGARLRAEAWIAPCAWLLIFLVVGSGSPASLGFGFGVTLGLHGVGFALGRSLRGSALPATAGMFLVALLLTAWPVRAALGRPGTRGPVPVAFARAGIELSPLVLVLESAGVDWTHTQPDMYSLSGVEEFPRRPYRGSLAAPVLLLVGSLLSLIAVRTQRTD